MGMFWTCVGAYVVGWFLCNVFLFQIVARTRENEERRRKFALTMAAEYYRLSHPEKVIMPDSIDEMHAKKA
jgi:hypothetical protein